MTELRDVTCHMGSHSVTCYPTQVNASRPKPSPQAGTRFTYPRGIEGWVDLGYPEMRRPGVELATSRSQVRHLGPLLYTLYTADLTYVVERHGMSTPVCRWQSSLHERLRQRRIYSCTETRSLCQLDKWLDVRQQIAPLRLNPTKTEVVWLGASQHVSRINISDIPMLPTSIKVAESAHDLGVILYAELTMSADVTALCRSGFFQLRQSGPSLRKLPKH